MAVFSNGLAKVLKMWQRALLSRWEQPPAHHHPVSPLRHLRSAPATLGSLPPSSRPALFHRWTSTFAVPSASNTSPAGPTADSPYLHSLLRSFHHPWPLQLESHSGHSLRPCTALLCFSVFIIIWPLAHFICLLRDDSTLQEKGNPGGRALSHVSLLYSCCLGQCLACGRI